MAGDKVVITVSGVLSMLKQGKTREEIRQHYGLTKTELKQLFQHEKLKGRKTHKAPSFKLVDDLEEQEAQPVATTGSASPSSGNATSGQQPDDFFARRNDVEDI